jgi:dTDP-D-glucose 4,6-dehydratase
LGWKPKWSFERAIYETTQWYKQSSSNRNQIQKFTQKQILDYIND